MKYLSPILLLIFTANSYGCPSIVGTWKSSREMSMEYNDHHANLSEKQSNFLRQIYGYMLLTYSENEILEHELPAVVINTGSGDHDFALKESNYAYKILSCTNSELKIEYDHPDFGITKATISFSGNNIYWVVSDLLPNAREYFVQVPK